jgi:hypothetical protein
MSVYPDGSGMTESQAPSSSAHFQPRTKSSRTSSERWVFGGEIQATKLNVTSLLEDSQDEPQNSVIYRETTIAPATENEAEQIVSTSKRKKNKKRAEHGGVADDQSGTQIPVDEGEYLGDEQDGLNFASDRI